jgi:hypothetical protein
MPAFQVLVIKEHVRGDIRQIDNRVAILYDTEEERYYYYGTRNDDGKKHYNAYNGTYEYSQWKSFSSFLDFLFGRYDEVMTIESHFFNIPEKDYDILSWDYFNKYLDSRTLVAAYDLKKVSIEVVENCLDMLVHC